MEKKIFIDIPYKELKKAIIEIEKKQGICDLLPHGRFTFDFVNKMSFGTRRVEESDGQEIKFDLIVCEGLGGNSTGCSANACKNCIIRKCKHKNTKEVKCKSYPKECSKEFHIECLDCGVLVDLYKEGEKFRKKMPKMIKELKRQNTTGGSS